MTIKFNRRMHAHPVDGAGFHGSSPIVTLKISVTKTVHDGPNRKTTINKEINDMKTQNGSQWLKGLAVLLVVGGGLLAGPAEAAPVTVLNPSFESPVLADNGYTTSTNYNWTYVTGGGGTFDCIYNPPEASFTGAGGNGTPAGTATGANTLFNNTAALGAWSRNVQVLTDTLQAGTYTLTVAVGKDKTTVVPDFTLDISTSALGLEAPLVRLTGSDSGLTADLFTDKTISLVVAPGNSHIGETLRIALGSYGIASGTEQVWFDNVRLDFTAVPEPCTLGLLGVALLGLMVSRKRR